MLTLVLAGDVMLGRGVDAALRHVRPEEPWGDLLPLFHEADLRIVNLECALTRHTQPWRRTPKVFHFRADPSAVAVLEAARVDAVSLANNHTLDFEEAGLLETVAVLDRAGIRHAGAGPDVAAARRPAIVETREGAVALLAVTDNEPPFAAGPGRPGTSYFPVSLDPDVLGEIGAMLAAGRDAGARTVVFSNHWGPNMVERPAPLFEAFARAVIDRGADVYYGHSAHLTQGIEIYGGKPILYDTGDFIDDYAVDPVLRNDRSCLFRLVLEAGRVVRVEIVPVSLSYAQVSIARGAEREAILARMVRLSAELGTALTRGDGGLEVGVPAA